MSRYVAASAILAAFFFGAAAQVHAQFGYGFGGGGYGYGGGAYGGGGGYGGGYSDPWNRPHENYDPNPTYGLPAYYRLMPPAFFSAGHPTYGRSISSRRAIAPSNPAPATAGAWTNETIEVRGRRIPAVRLAPH
jgi:hypothetical protein